MPEPSPNRALLIVLSYLWILALVPLLIQKQDAEIQWHAKHGVVLMVAEGILLFAYILLTSLISLASLGFLLVFSFLLVFGWVAVLGVHIVAIVKGVNGARLIVPGISEYANRF